MDNQHRKIKGYRDLSQSEIDLMNVIKGRGSDLEELIAALGECSGIDHRWVAIGKTHLQEGLMALTRAVAKPASF